MCVYAHPILSIVVDSYWSSWTMCMLPLCWMWSLVGSVGSQSVHRDVPVFADHKANSSVQFRAWTKSWW